MELADRIERVGETVRRDVGYWSASVQRLLCHLEAMSFAQAPRFVGHDDNGREILTWIHGEVGHYPVAGKYWSEASLCAAAIMLRRYHDATTNFVLTSGDRWRMKVPDDQPAEVICHNDFAHYNCVFDGAGPIALIDFDMAAPGSRAWDLAYALYRFVPFCAPEKYENFGLRGLAFSEVERAASFLRAYGCDPRRFDFGLLLRRVEVIREMSAETIAQGDVGSDRLVRESHLDAYDADLAYLRSRLPHIKCA